MRDILAGLEFVNLLYILLSMMIGYSDFYYLLADCVVSSLLSLECYM